MKRGFALERRELRSATASLEDAQYLFFDKFFSHFLWCCEKGIFEAKPDRVSNYTQHTATPCDSVSKEGRDVVIITDNTDENSNLARMIDRFRAALPYESRVVNIAEYPFTGGCLGCFNCATTGK